jgi:Co/Zn/Cd efflux system component
MKRFHADMLLVLAVILSVIPIAFYVSAMITLDSTLLIFGVIIQIAGAIMISVGKSQVKKCKEQDSIDLERLRRENEERDKQRKQNLT